MDKIKIAICGPVDAGKSSLVGVLNSGEMDNGRGLARNKILKHKHEIESGRTSNITFNSIKYEVDNDKIHVNSVDYGKGKFTINKKFNCTDTSKAISLIDLAGHEKYFRTTLFGVSGMFVDYGIVVIGANSGITKLTEEHIRILYYLNIPIIFVITKIDMAPENIYNDLKENLIKFVKNRKMGKKHMFVREDNHFSDLIDIKDWHKTIIPIISVSNKTGYNIENFHNLIFSLPTRLKWDKDSIGGSVFFIDGVFKINGIGLVAAGTLKGNIIKNKQKLWLGPYNGKFLDFTVRSLHNSIRENVEEITDNETSCIAMKFNNPKIPIDKKHIKKGMIIVCDPTHFINNVVKRFKAKVKILHHATTIKEGYTPVIHCGAIRQCASIIMESSSYLRSGDEKEVVFEFKFRPEFIEENAIFFFRDGSTKGIGKVTELVH
jgi:GTPase